MQALRSREPAVERNHAGLIVRLGIALVAGSARGGTTIGIIWFATALLNRALDVAISGIAADWNVRHYPGSLEQRARAMLRRSR